VIDRRFPESGIILESSADLRNSVMIGAIHTHWSKS